MRKSRFSETPIVPILKEADAGRPVKEICRKRGISDATYYNWKSKYGVMETSDLKRVKELGSENARFNRTCRDELLNIMKPDFSCSKPSKKRTKK